MISHDVDDFDPNPPADYKPYAIPEEPSRPVFQSEFVAWKVLLGIHNYPAQFQADLFTRGLFTYRNDNGVFQEEPFIYDVEQFALAAADDPDHREVAHNPWVPNKQPGRLALLFAATANGMKHSPAYEMPPSRIEYERYAESILWAQSTPPCDPIPATLASSGFSPNSYSGGASRTNSVPRRAGPSPTLLARSPMKATTAAISRCR
jgi:hypothetical protein